MIDAASVEAPAGRRNDFIAHTCDRRAHWDRVAQQKHEHEGWGGYYHRRLAEVVAHHVPPGQRVLEVGCGAGDLLAALHPCVGLGLDLSSEMLSLARTRHPSLVFVQADAHELPLRGTFDVVVLSDLVNDLWDVQKVLQQVRGVCHPGTRIVVNFYSRLWELPLRVAQQLRLATTTLPQNWLTVEDAAHLSYLANFEVLWTKREMLWPLGTPLAAPVCNEYLVRFWPMSAFALTNVLMARPKPEPPRDPDPLVSVIVPARNEAGNVERIFSEVPELGGGTEIVFVEGHSRDNTWEVVQETAMRHPSRRCQLLRQTGEGKGDAVRLGFERASGDLLMILDADLTVPPEDLARAYDALRQGKAEFVNGVRLVYPMAGQAMRFANLLGNKFFSLAFSWLLGQSVKDTLCGTKALSRDNYRRIAANRSQFGDFDPFGDFDLLFGAAKLNLRIVDLPVRYRSRTYGTTNIQRWRHGVLLLRMVMFAARRIKFV